MRTCVDFEVDVSDAGEDDVDDLCHVDEVDIGQGMYVMEMKLI